MQTRHRCADGFSLVARVDHPHRTCLHLYYRVLQRWTNPTSLLVDKLFIQFTISYNTDFEIYTMPSTIASMPHPLASLSVEETNLARDIILASHPKTVVDFRIITLQEPSKADLVSFLQLEHSGKLQPNSPRPPRLAKVHYDVIDDSKIPIYCESIVDVEKRKRISHEVIRSDAHASLTMSVSPSPEKMIKLTRFQPRV